MPSPSPLYPPCAYLVPRPYPRPSYPSSPPSRPPSLLTDSRPHQIILDRSDAPYPPRRTVRPPERSVSRSAGGFCLHGRAARGSVGGGEARGQDVPGVRQQRALPSTLPPRLAPRVACLGGLRVLFTGSWPIFIVENKAERRKGRRGCWRRRRHVKDGGGISYFFLLLILFMSRCLSHAART